MRNRHLASGIRHCSLEDARSASDRRMSRGPLCGWRSLRLPLGEPPLSRLEEAIDVVPPDRGIAAPVQSDRGAIVVVHLDRGTTFVAPPRTNRRRAAGSGSHCRHASGSESRCRRAFGSAPRRASGFGTGCWSRDWRPPSPHALVELPPPHAPRWATVARASWWGIKN